MKLLIDFFPLALFAAAYKWYDIYVGTGVLMAATVLQMLLLYRLEGRLQTLHKITLALILAFGTLTLAFHDERFIKWKPTVLYGCMALGMAAAVWVMKKNVLKLLLGSQLELPEAVWQRLNASWVLYSAAMAALNAYVVLNYSTQAWVSFKLWGYAFPLAFLVAQGLYIAPHVRRSAELAPPPPNDVSS